MMTLQDYKNGLEFWKNFDKSEITAEKVKELFTNYSNPNYFLWIRSKEYYEENIKRLSNNARSSNPLDDTYLRTVILPLLPDNGRTTIPPSEVDKNWKNPEWWYNNFRALLRILENMYIKKSVKESLKQSKGLPKGPYHNWLTRVVQYINTHRGETYLPTVIKELVIDILAHDGMHEGLPTEAECKPDFSIIGCEFGAELKICYESYFKEHYKVNLATDYINTVKNDFHGAHYAFYIIKGPTLKLYYQDISTSINALTYEDITDKVDLSGLSLILAEDNGKLPFKDWPALPCALLFGLKASWLN